MKSRWLTLTVLFLLGSVLGSLKLVTDGGLSDQSPSNKLSKKSKLTVKKSGGMSHWPGLSKSKVTLPSSLKEVKQSRKLQSNRRRRRPVGRGPRMEPITPGGRFVSDKVLLDIHRRSLTSSFADPRSGNVRQRPGTECDLYVELEPMFYTTLTRTSSTVMTFSSSCMSRVTLNIENVIGRNRNINWAYHPRKIYLSLFGNLYIVDYSIPKVTDRKDVIRSLRYSRANVQRTFSAPRNIRLGRRNSVYLAPQRSNTLTRANLRRFSRLRGYLRCRTRSRRFSIYSTRIRRRRAMIARLRKQGFSTREISRMIRGSQFGPRATAQRNIETPLQVAGLAPLTTRRRPSRRRSTKKRRRSSTKKPTPRQLEVKEVSDKQEDSPLSTLNESGQPRKTQSVTSRTSEANSRHTSNHNSNPANTRGRRRKRPKTLRPRRPRRPQSPFEREEERQRRENRKFIRSRLRNNFVWELVTVCTLR